VGRRLALADVAKPGYAPASEAGGREAMRVRPPPSAPHSLPPTIEKEARAMSRKSHEEECSF
jgi:hypothetical protein